MKMFRLLFSISCFLVLMTMESLSLGPVDDGNYTMSGDEGDYITLGGSYNYSTAVRDRISVTASNPRTIGLRIEGFYTNDYWTVDLQAPDGDNLVVGEYLNVSRYPFNLIGSGLSVSGNGRGCNTVSGSFVIKEISMGPNNEVDRLEATLEQHCGSVTTIPALRANISIINTSTTTTSTTTTNTTNSTPSPNSGSIANSSILLNAMVVALLFSFVRVKLN